jgi:hypothetical protein
MSERPDEVRVVVVKLEGENAWIAACMSENTYDVIGAEDWDKWKRDALPLVLADWRSYEVREVVLRVPQDTLDALFAVGPVTAEVVLTCQQCGDTAPCPPMGRAAPPCPHPNYVAGS